ncbi:hypothetical protein FH972_026203 [Carpinus fangiana]|uniref:Pectinesterase inhibitor domain-containing protein n=1 Tax=Carpinus fangiana TaxID=176857 RepID=A0A5N6L398_9ROSI|nr:hypothetical protein FH972_026203 [Carpinus fangiana]
MLFSRATTLLLAATTAIAAPLQVRATSQDPVVAVAENDIGAISTAVVALTAAINGYRSGVLEATPILANTANVHLVNRKAYVDAVAAVTANVKANEEQSAEIVKFTADSVGVTIPQSIKALKAKREPLAKAGLTDSVVGALQLLKSDHDSYSAELIKVVAPGSLAAAKKVVLDIDNAIQSGIDYFSGSAGSK